MNFAKDAAEKAAKVAAAKAKDAAVKAKDSEMFNKAADKVADFAMDNPDKVRCACSSLSWHFRFVE